MNESKLMYCIRHYLSFAHNILNTGAASGSRSVQIYPKWSNHQNTIWYKMHIYCHHRMKMIVCKFVKHIHTKMKDTYLYTYLCTMSFCTHSFTVICFMCIFGQFHLCTFVVCSYKYHIMYIYVLYDW